MKVRTGRTLFNETWLSEMPNGIDTAGAYNQLVLDIQERIQFGAKIIKLPNNLNKIDGKQIMYYWYGDNNNIILGCEIEILPYGLKIALTGKNPNNKKKSTICK